VDEAYQFRPATNADAKTVRSIVFAALQEYGLPPDPTSTDADLNDIEASYQRSGGLFDLLVDSTGVVVGSIGLVPTGGGRCELRKMYLAPSHRGRGLGKRLLRHALERAPQLGFRRVELETANVLRVAIGLYESFGFRVFDPDHLSAGPARADLAYYLDLVGP
jgi:GNAT superfamily N-acetyltransferase